MFKADDPATKAPSVRNPFWKPQKGAFKIPGFGEVSIYTRFERPEEFIRPRKFHLLMNRTGLGRVRNRAVCR